MFCDCANLRQWEDISHTEIARFLPAAHDVVSLTHPDACVNVSGYMPWVSRMTGGWEQFLVDTLHVQYSMFASPWSAATTSILSPIGSCQDLGALPVSALHDIVARSETVCFVRSDTHINPSDTELSMLDAALNSPHPFSLVIMLNRALSATWNMWVANWEQKGRAALLWGCDTLRLKTYLIQEGTEAW